MPYKDNEFPKKEYIKDKYSVQ